jgi:transcriptional regulator with XRE-family HTH domain
MDNNQVPDFVPSDEHLSLTAQVVICVKNTRLQKGLSQKALAHKLGTTQSALARLESGAYLPSLRLLEKIATVLEAEIIIKFKAKQNKPIDPELKKLIERYENQYE